MVDYAAMWWPIAKTWDFVSWRDYLIVAYFSVQNAKPKTILSWKILGKRKKKQNQLSPLMKANN